MASTVLKGRIVIYSIVGCPHCLAAKSTLQELKLPFTDVSVDRFPPKVREWVKEKTKKSSVPQIFFNQVYIGGNAEFQAIVKDEAKLKELVDEVTNNDAPDDSDPLLPHPSEAIDGPKKDGGVEFHCEPDEYSAFISELKQSGIVQDQRIGGCFFGKKVKNAFSGRDFVSWVMKQKNVDEAKALEMGQELISRKFGFHTDGDEKMFKNDPNAFYQLGSDFSALNSDKANNCAQRKAVDVAEDLRKLILQIFASFLSKDGKRVDYKGIKESQMFESYRSMARELQRVDLSQMSREDKLAFFINIYNALVIHGNIERGTPTNTWQRYRFFSSVSYDLGGQNFTLNDIENGILRGNKSSMATLYMIPFKANDPRLSISLEQAEPRIHFALNCGAKSCPPIKTFTSGNIDSELKSATESYLENDDAIVVDLEKNVVHLSMLFNWYQSDFGTDKGQVLTWILENMDDTNEKKAQLKELLEKCPLKDVKVKNITYDWGHNDQED